MRKMFVLLFLVVMTSVSVYASPYFQVEAGRDWAELLEEPNGEDNFIEPANADDWNHFLANLKDPEIIFEGLEQPFEQMVFVEPTLYVNEGPAPNYDTPEAGGLVMAWGDEQGQVAPEGYTSGWIYEYGVDPDLTNCTISLTVSAPPAITQVTFGLTDINGFQCVWTWNNSSAGGTIPASPPGAPTVITIDTASFGMPAFGINTPNPPAQTFVMNPGFDMTQVVSFLINETFHSSAGVYIMPPPGSGVSLQLYWNAWDNFSVKPNSGSQPQPQPNTKNFIKWSQPPEVLDGMIYGWDQWSYYHPENFRMAADDWKCTDPRPVTDFHWWGSYIGWEMPYPPTVVPDYFLMCIWKDIPKDLKPDGYQYSRPGELIWTHKCDNWVWNYAGVDMDPRWEYFNPDNLEDFGYYYEYGKPQEAETCFQFNQLLSEDEYFFQEGEENIYWISIAAVYENLDPRNPDEVPYPWGWKTRPHKNIDIAGVITDVSGNWPPLVPNANAANGFFPLVLPYPPMGPGQVPEGEAFDFAFELSTNQGYKGDLDNDYDVDMEDFALMAENWLMGK